MHSAAFCRRQAEILAAQARHPHLTSRRRALLEHLSSSWAISAEARAFLDQHTQATSQAAPGSLNSKTIAAVVLASHLG